MTATSLAHVRPKRHRSRNKSTPKAEPATVTGRVYVASPLLTFRTPRYDAKLLEVRAHFPRADVLPARDVFASNAEWRARWPTVLPTMRALVFFDDEAGFLGLGTFTEVADAYRVGVPVWFLDNGGELHRLDAATFAEMPGFDPDAAGESDIVLFPHMTDPLSARIDPARYVIVGRVESITDVVGFLASLERQSAGKAAKP